MNVNPKDISIISRYITFIMAYMYMYEKNININDLIDYIIDDNLFEHIDHISDSINSIESIFELYKKNKPEINKKLNTYIKNNTVDNIGIVGIILTLIINELMIDNKNIHLIMDDYFIICNIINIPTSYIKMINKIVKSINNFQINI